jgi:hypothetical protein
LDGAGVDSAVDLQLLSEHRSRVSDHSRALWNLIVLSQWLEWASQRQPLNVDVEAEQAACL